MKAFQIVPVAAAAFLAIGCAGNRKEQTVQTERVEQVETLQLRPQEISRVLEFSTTLQAYQSMSISPSVTGNIEHIYVEVGKRVAQGDLLVRMDQNQLNTTKLTYANLQVELARMEALKETGTVSQQSYDQTKLSFDQTRQSLEFLEANTFVRAQFAGVVTAKNYEDGELYSGQPILAIAQIGVLKALISVPETYYPQLRSGMSLVLKSDIYPDDEFPASIEVIYPTIDASTHTFQVKLRIPNSSNRLRPGMYVRTSLPMGTETAMVVPYQTVLKLTGSNDRYVFIDDNGKAKRVAVTLGQRFDENIEIISDEISEGDRIVSAGQARLVDGVKLNVVREN